MDLTRTYTTSRMRCVGIWQWPRSLGIHLDLEDDKGLIGTGFPITLSGMIRKALGLDREEDWALGDGREIMVWFGVNGTPERLFPIPERQDG